MQAFSPTRQPVRPSRPVVVGVGDLKVIKGPGSLVTHGLGSCVAIAVYDPQAQVAALLHVLLPDSKLDVARSKREPAVFADTGVRAMVLAFKGQGGRLERSVVRIAGGAAVFKTTTINVGKRNVLAVRRQLWTARVKVTSEDVGGNESRTVFLDVPRGAFRIRIPGRPEITR